MQRKPNFIIKSVLEILMIRTWSLYVWTNHAADRVLFANVCPEWTP